MAASFFKSKTSSPSVAIITACNDPYVPLLEGLIGSIRKQQTSRTYSIIVIDVGLSENIRRSLEREGIIVRQIPRSVRMPQNAAPETLSGVIRPYIPELALDAEFIMWADCDIWLQTPGVIDYYCDAAEHCDVVAVAEFDRSYPSGIPRDLQKQGSYPDTNLQISRFDFLFNIYRVHYDAPYANYLAQQPLLNDGLICARINSPMWKLWKGELQRCLSLRGERFYKEDMNRMADFMVNLLTFNAPLREHKWNAVVLPASFNWMGHLRLPSVNKEGKLCHPMYPHKVLDVLHLAAGTKWNTYDLQQIGGGASTVNMPLKSPHIVSLG